MTYPVSIKLTKLKLKMLLRNFSDKLQNKLSNLTLGMLNTSSNFLLQSQLLKLNTLVNSSVEFSNMKKFLRICKKQWNLWEGPLDGKNLCMGLV